MLDTKLSEVQANLRIIEDEEVRLSLEDSHLVYLEKEVRILASKDKDLDGYLERQELNNKEV